MCVCVWGARVCVCACVCACMRYLCVCMYVLRVRMCMSVCYCPVYCSLGTGLVPSQRTLCPLRRTNSAPQLSNIPSSSSSSSSSSPSPPPPELLEKRRVSLQDYNDVFLSYMPYFPIALPPAAVAVHLAFDLAQRLSSS